MGQAHIEVELLAYTPNPQQLIEQAGRTCYDSLDKIVAGHVRYNTPDLFDKEITLCWESAEIKGMEIGKEYLEMNTFDGTRRWIPLEVAPPSYIAMIRMLRKNGHESVLEHASATFRISGVSRALSHQLVRHRVASYSQKSQRYVKEADFDYVIPPDINANIQARTAYIQLMVEIGRKYTELSCLGIKKEDARFVLPNACETEIVMSANFREWRHVLHERLSVKAQWEIRMMAALMWKGLSSIAPIVFEDYKESAYAVIKSMPYKE